ncbi:hypothetical protein D0Z07_4590 [Hyphodiscus hymeniophilus]|uniref:Uncharacterized protein n=1 Tax=Hyphodiscus hymeniophilus TaxID=353542 RepID=A0A9P6VJX1_9HELO|nr:hypothetical protein D0Z07_4590 [Hyphodiscus hymeniophilus]
MLIALVTLIAFPLSLVASPATFAGYETGIMNFNGTIGGYEEILSQMDTINPDWRTKISARHDALVQVRSADAKAGQNWQPAEWAGIVNGIQALDSINGCCGVGARTCVRIACESSDAIWYCNDVSSSPSKLFVDLALFAENID